MCSFHLKKGYNKLIILVLVTRKRITHNRKNNINTAKLRTGLIGMSRLLLLSSSTRRPSIVSSFALAIRRRLASSSVSLWTRTRHPCTLKPGALHISTAIKTAIEILRTLCPVHVSLSVRVLVDSVTILSRSLLASRRSASSSSVIRANSISSA